MAEVKFAWKSLEHGWATFMLESPSRRYASKVSDLTDAPCQLAEAALSVLRGEPLVRFSFNLEPAEMRWVLERNASRMSINVDVYPDWGRGERIHRFAEVDVVPEQFASEVVQATEWLVSVYGNSGSWVGWEAHPIPFDVLDDLRAALARGL